ncbi:hypothetical protein Bca52824_076409 [Brassica carinata]|uniref:Uncharacterized protein n=1 Tax=Brassica carinata TaxID=52824 RepID=A0A8X7TWB3_BRACI|nr:hypothetical protein Bca52824_076409 [Brassica carinata]
MMGLLDLEKHFAFYGAYHSNPINIVIHIIFVWPIVFTALLLLYPASPIYDLSQLGFPQSMTLDAALMCFACWVGSSVLADRLGPSLAVKVGLASQLLCWTGQFLGHGLFEKRAPALLDNLAQAFLMAPFFVLLEILQLVFGYEPYPGFQARVNAKVESSIKEWREKQIK